MTPGGILDVLARLSRSLTASAGLTRRDALVTLHTVAGLVLRTFAAAVAITRVGRPLDAWSSFSSGRPRGVDMDDQRTTERASHSYRLPTHIIPTRYELMLEPDLAAARFSGQEVVMLTVAEPTSEILLNAVDLEIDAATVEQGDGTRYPATIEMEEATERCRLRVPTRLARGEWRLRLGFHGILNDKLRGFYRSTYRDKQGRSHALAATQFEATDARRAFPCWDEPAFKAVFACAVRIDPTLTAVSNTAIVSERREGNKKRVQFADTIRMSTYLVAFVIGELEASEPVMVGTTPLRVWSVPGKTGLSAFGLEIGRFSLEFFERYYGIPYPGGKLDLLAIPDFASGAMENLGAITFRETALLVDPQRATHGELERVADVVAHENAHMWFGDLVTMTWWNGLWLNEAFATFMEMLAVDAWKPEWQRWTTFGVSRSAAMAVDGLHSTRPIEYPVVAPKDADAMFDVLTYEKGASVLRMMEQYIGPDVFRAGVQQYLRTHAYGNADTGDLWAALGEAARQPIPAVMDGWIFKPGYPVVTVTLDDNDLLIGQQRFTYLPVPPNGDTTTGDQRWQIPLRIRITTGRQTETRRIMLTETQTRVPLPGGAQSVLVNEGGHGFYRVRYSRPLLDRLLPLVPDGLSPIERFIILNDAWAATVAGLSPLDEYLELTEAFQRDRHKSVWDVLLGSLSTQYRLVSPAQRPLFEALIRERLQPIFAELGWTPKAGESELTKQLRADVLRMLGTYGNDRSVQDRAEALIHEPGDVDVNVIPAIIVIGAYIGDRARYDDYTRRYTSASTPQEERRYLYALALFRSPELLEQTLRKTTTGDIRTQDGPFIVRMVMANLHGRELAWNFVKRDWETMERLFPKNGLRRMCEGVTSLDTPELERDVHHFFEERKIDLGGKTLEQYLEQLRVAVSFRLREAERLSQYLEGRPTANRARSRSSGLDHS